MGGPPALLGHCYAPSDGDKSRLESNVHAWAHASPKSERHSKLALYCTIPITSYRAVRFEEPRRIKRLWVLE